MKHLLWVLVLVALTGCGAVNAPAPQTLTAEVGLRATSTPPRVTTSAQPAAVPAQRDWAAGLPNSDYDPYEDAQEAQRDADAKAEASEWKDQAAKDHLNDLYGEFGECGNHIDTSNGEWLPGTSAEFIAHCDEVQNELRRIKG
jgi:hypothetical protein